MRGRCLRLADLLVYLTLVVIVAGVSDPSSCPQAVASLTDSASGACLLQGLQDNNISQICDCYAGALPMVQNLKTLECVFPFPSDDSVTAATALVALTGFCRPSDNSSESCGQEVQNLLSSSTVDCSIASQPGLCCVPQLSSPVVVSALIALGLGQQNESDLLLQYQSSCSHRCSGW